MTRWTDEELAAFAASDAYEEKYVGSPYLHGIVGPKQQAATVKVSPRA